MSEDRSRTLEETDKPLDAAASDLRSGGEDATGERGADSPEHAAKHGGERDAARPVKDESERARHKIAELEENPPEKLEDWPTDETKYETFGGPEGEHGYHEGPERKLGPPDLRHREDGAVEVGGEEVDHPEEFKGEPIPGGPTDPNAPDLGADKTSTHEGEGAS